MSDHSLPLRRSGALRFVCLIALLALSACAGTPPGGRGNPNVDPATGVVRPTSDPAVVARYQAMPDGDILIPAVQQGYLVGQNIRTEVYYTGPDAPGSIVVDPYARLLYFIEPGGRAIRYGIAVGREGYGFAGDATVGRKRDWPSWTPTKNMVRRDPEIYGPVAGGLPGGLENPLGARALYLYRGNRDTMYRIHGTNNASTIGRATSAGCIRLFNQDIIDLYNRTAPGAYVHVRTREESSIAEDPMVENAHGLMVKVQDLPPEVQQQVQAGYIPWPKFTPMIGINASDPVFASPTPGSDPALSPEAPGVFEQIN